jgi:hypothetical protein
METYSSEMTELIRRAEERILSRKTMPLEYKRGFRMTNSYLLIYFSEGVIMLV